MGLDTSHDCWHGPYSSFNRFREMLAKLIGMDLSAMEGFCENGKGLPWPTDEEEPLCILLNHSDCDGKISAKDCAPLARRMKELLPLVPEESGAYPHYMREKTTLFIRGLHKAIKAKKPVDFH